MKNSISIATLVKTKKEVCFQILKQQLSEKAMSALPFNYNGFTIKSSANPEVRNHTLYIQGIYQEDNDNLLVCSLASFDGFISAIRKYLEFVNKAESPTVLKNVLFKYKGGSTSDYRRIGVTQETSTHLKGIDLDNDNAFRSFKKSLIQGDILTVT